MVFLYIFSMAVFTVAGKFALAVVALLIRTQRFAAGGRTKWISFWWSSCFFLLCRRCCLCCFGFKWVCCSCCGGHGRWIIAETIPFFTNILGEFQTGSVCRNDFRRLVCFSLRLNYRNKLDR